jgi:hypothetical protein
MKKVAIMQPTYLPWMGYFSLINQVDTFVIYDDVQFDKRSWQQRNKIKTQSGTQWLTVPVLTKNKFSQKINDVSISKESGFEKDHIKAIEINYSKAPFFKIYKNEIFDCLEANHHKILELNYSLILKISNILNIQTDFIKSSKLKDLQGKKDERLIEICKELSAKEYVSPEGSKSYLEGGESFLANDIKLTYQSFKHPIYPQIYGAFESHMSVIDALFNCGSDKTFELIEESSMISSI